MEKSKYRLNLMHIESIHIRYGSSLKKLFIKNVETETAFTQFAWSRFEPGDACELHRHPTMEVYFCP